MKKLNIIYLLFVFSACEKDYNKNIEIDFPYTTNVICLMADDVATTDVRLSQIARLGEPTPTDNNFFRNASVSINDGLTNYNLVYDSLRYIFQIDSVKFKVAKGKSYTLKIILADGSVITSSCEVPIETIPNLNYKLKDINDNIYSYSLNWQNDSPNLKYYITQFYFYRQGISNRFILNTITYQKPEGITAVSLNGTCFIRTGSFGGTADDIYPALYYTNEETFRYYDSALKNVSGDLFGSPAVVPTNIVGGTGCFGALISQ